MAMRCFLGLMLPPAVQRWLQAMVAPLQQNGQGLRWVQTEQLHVTVRFLGEVPDDKIIAIQQALEERPLASPLHLQIQGLGCFGSKGKPRVLWAGLAGDHAPLHALATEVDARLMSLGFAAEDRAFHPHITLARGRRQGRQKVRLGELPEGFHSEPFALSALNLVQSQLSPQGAKYVVLQEFPLRPE